MLRNFKIDFQPDELKEEDYTKGTNTIENEVLSNKELATGKVTTRNTRDKVYEPVMKQRT